MNLPVDDARARAGDAVEDDGAYECYVAKLCRSPDPPDLDARETHAMMSRTCRPARQPARGLARSAVGWVRTEEVLL